MYGLDITVVAAAIFWILGIQVVLGRTGKTGIRTKGGPGLWERIQIQRRVQHLLSGIVVMYYQRTSKSGEFLLFLAVSTVTILVVHLARLRSGRVQKYFTSTFKHILRDSEKKGRKVPGALYFLIGNFLAFYLYPRDFCSFAILAVAVGDPAAGIIGTIISSRKLVGSKSLAGTIGCGLVSGATLTWFAIIFGILPFDGIVHCAFACTLFGICSAVAELLAVVDDNLTMPIIFGICFRTLTFMTGSDELIQSIVIQVTTA